MTPIFPLSNDALGLTGQWQIVPKEGPRPLSAIEFDRKSDAPGKPGPDYGNQISAYRRKIERLREEKKRAANSQAGNDYEEEIF